MMHAYQFTPRTSIGSLNFPQKSLYHLMPKLPVLASRTTWMVYRKRRDILSINIICPDICLIAINLIQC